MARTEAIPRFYSGDEYLGLVYHLIPNLDIIRYLKKHPWSTHVDVGRALNIQKRVGVFCLSELEYYGLVESKLMPVTRATPKKSGELRRRQYALARDCDKRIDELDEAIRLSQRKYSSRHGVKTERSKSQLSKFMTDSQLSKFMTELSLANKSLDEFRNYGRKPAKPRE